MIDPSGFALCEVVDADALARHPVWAPFGDPEDRARILSWGVDADRLDRELARYDDCGPSMHFPVLELDPLPAKAGLILAVRFASAAGHELDGWAMPPHAFGIWAGGEEFAFNRTLPGAAARSAEGLAALLGTSRDALFPLRWDSGRTGADGEPVAGELERFWERAG